MFFAIASRRLAPDDYSALSVLWGLMFAVGNGLMQPLEQEVARAVSARRAAGAGPGPVIRRAAAVGAGFAVVVSVAAVATHELILDRWLSDDAGLLAAFVLGLLGFCAGHLTRGVLSSHHRFVDYAAFFATDGVARVVLAAGLAVAGVAAAGAYGLVLALSPFLGIVVALSRPRGLLAPGPPAPWSELTRALGWLLVGTVSLSLVVQGGTIAVGWLATADQQDAAGVFLNGLQTARIPLFLFQAVLASLLPKLSRLAGTGALDEFRAALRRLVATILGLGVLATVAAAALGPSVIGVVFGTEAALGPRDLALLSGAFVLVMAAICLDQALVALAAHRRMALGWAVALGAFVAVVAMGEDLYLRVELGLVAAGAVALAWMAGCVAEQLARRRRPHDLDLSEAVAELPLQQ